MTYKNLKYVSIGSIILALSVSSEHLFAAEEPVTESWTATVADKKTTVSSEKASAVALDTDTEIKKASKNIQELKRQVIDLNKDLRLMEEKLLFPSSTKYSVFISLSSGQFFTLEGIKLKLDDKFVASNIYSEKQRQALIRGGIQKFYITNLNEGKHSATLFFTGVGPSGRDYKRASTIEFEKGPAGEYLEVAISDDSVTQEPVFSIKQW
ncbi:MAG: AraC family transcriptional regulator [Pseudomonadota bacterium]